MTVRLATRADEDEIIELLHGMHAEGGMLSLDIDCAKELFARAFNHEGGIIGVLGEPGDIQGMIYLLISRFWYTKDNHLEEIFNYVRPDCRGSDRAETLIRFAKKCSDEISIPLIIGVLTNKRLESKVRLYRRVLGYPSGAFFVYGSKWIEEGQTSEDFWHKPFPTRSSRGKPRPKSNGAATAH